MQPKYKAVQLFQFTRKNETLTLLINKRHLNSTKAIVKFLHCVLNSVIAFDALLIENISLK